MWMPFVDCPKEMGTMAFGSKTHKLSNLEKQPISENSENYFEQFIKHNNIQL